MIQVQPTNDIEIPKGLCIDKEEYESALRMSKAHVLAKQLGCKLPYSIAKKLNCRCGKVFVYPDKFLAHRAVCEVLHVRDKEIVDRKPVEKIEAVKVKKIKHQLFTCIGCGFEFHKKSYLKHHKQLCNAFAVLDAIRIRGEEYLARHKKEEKHGKAKKVKRHKSGKRT